MRYLRPKHLIAALLLVLAGCSGSSTDSIRLAEDLRERNSKTLLDALATGSPDQRLAAARAMGRIQGAEYADALAQAEGSDSRPLRLEAIFALGQLGLAEAAVPPESAQDAAIAALADTDARIVAAAAEALGKLAPEGAADTLVPLLAHEDPAVRREAVHALFRLRFVPVWRKQAEDPPDLPTAAVAALIRTLEDENPEVRRAVAHAFSRYGQAEAVPQLLLRLEDSDRWVRVFTVRAIGRSEEPDTAEALRQTLGDEDLHVRAEALSAMARLGTVEALPASLEQDPSFHVRAALARALAGSTDPITLEILLRLENDRSVSVRAAAIEAVAARRGEAHADALRRHLDDENWPVRAAAARAAALAGKAAPTLLDRAIADPDVRVRTAALESAEEATPGTDLVREMLVSPDLALRGTALALYSAREEPANVDLLGTVYDASVGDEWIEIREAIADSLADLEGSRPLLERIAGTDPAPSVRGKARLGLGGGEASALDDDAPAPEASPLLGRLLTEDPLVVLETTKGEMIVRCLASQAPVHVTGFVERVRAGFYDGLAWHRVVPNFVIQGGDPRGDGWGGDGTTLRDEINTARYVRGAVGMPKAGKDTGSCQIFITHLPTPHLDGNYTIFGLVESGLDVIDEIEVGDRILRAYVR